MTDKERTWLADFLRAIEICEEAGLPLPFHNDVLNIRTETSEDFREKGVRLGETRHIENGAYAIFRRTVGSVMIDVYIERAKWDGEWEGPKPPEPSPLITTKRLLDNARRRFNLES